MEYLWTAKDTWLWPGVNLGGIGPLYNLTMDPSGEKYTSTFMVHGPRVSRRTRQASTLRTTGGRVGIYPVVIEFMRPGRGDGLTGAARLDVCR